LQRRNQHLNGIKGTITLTMQQKIRSHIQRKKNDVVPATIRPMILTLTTSTKKNVYEDSKAKFAADYTLLEVFMRQAIHKFSPATKYKKTVMYWSTKVKTAAAHMLIERHKDEIPNLLERYGGQMALEIRFASELRFLANNERAIQTRQIKKYLP
jgi:hypothetical protein